MTSVYDRFQRSLIGDYHEPRPWNSVASVYDLFQPLAFRLAGVLGPYSYRDYATNMVSRVPFPPGAVILDAACGTGFLHQAVAGQLPPDGRCHAVDFSPAMLQRARMKLSPAQQALFSFHRVHLEELADVFPHHLFDGAFLSFTLAVLADPRKAMTAIHRVLKPGVLFVISTLSRDMMIQKRDRLFWRALIRNHHQRYLHREEIEGLCRDTGFTPVSIDTIGWSWLIVLRSDD